MELPTAAGALDNLWITPEGGIVLGECKLFRNPEARRQVIVQALDYARAIAGPPLRGIRGSGAQGPRVHVDDFVVAGP